MQVFSSSVARFAGASALVLTTTLSLAVPAEARASFYNTRRTAQQSIAPTGVATPAAREQRLREKGMQAGSAMLIRIFKAESELEVWMRKGQHYELFSTYPICRFSGKLGPKVREGDRQAPEGFYSVSTPHLHRHGRWPRALDVGYPNSHDRANGRTGSAILVHGGCSSIGCFAMTNPVMEEIFQLSEAALASGQDTIPIHIFPFRMTEQKLAEQGRQPWTEFWRNLKEAYDLFEETRRPPHVSVCGRKYLIRDPDLDMGSPTTPRRMIRLVRMMRGEFPVRPGECSQEATPTYEAIAAASRIAHKLRAAEVPAVPEASMPVPQVPVPVPATAPASRVAAKARMQETARPDAAMPIPPVPVPAVRSVRATLTGTQD